MSDQAKQTEPQIRVRIQHSHTLEEGWRLSETTVEWTGIGEPDWALIRDVQTHAHASGLFEAQDRNRAEAIEKARTS